MLNMLRSRLCALIILSVISFSGVIYAEDVTFENQAKVENNGQNVDSANVESTDSVVSENEPISAQLQNEETAEEDIDENETSEEAGGGFFSGLITFLLVGACVYLFLKLRLLERRLEDYCSQWNFKKDDGSKEALDKMNDSLKKMQGEIKALKEENEKIRRGIQEMKQENKPSGNNGVVNETSGNNDSQNGEKTQPKIGKQYVSGMSINEYENLYVPVRSLKDDNSLLLMLELDNKTGKGFYTINPNVRNVIDHMETLSMYVDGLSGYNGSSGVEVVSKGELRKEGYDWVVVKKLKLEFK